jgi:hypothetical protein
LAAYSAAAYLHFTLYALREWHHRAPSVTRRQDRDSRRGTRRRSARFFTGQASSVSVGDARLRPRVGSCHLSVEDLVPLLQTLMLSVAQRLRVRLPHRLRGCRLARGRCAYRRLARSAPSTRRLRPVERTNQSTFDRFDPWLTPGCEREVKNGIVRPLHPRSPCFTPLCAPPALVSARDGFASRRYPPCDFELPEGGYEHGRGGTSPRSLLPTCCHGRPQQSFAFRADRALARTTVGGFTRAAPHPGGCVASRDLHRDDVG